jgi:hypothetical protein
MLVGLGGHLLSSAFVERHLVASEDAPNMTALRRDLTAWRTRAAICGPASTPRTLLQASAAPLFDALGFDEVSDVTIAGDGLAATLRAGGRSNARPVALLVTPWAEPFDPLWRPAVLEAVRRGARWCVLFDGLRLRIVDAGRLYARRHLEFDLELTIEQHTSLQTLLRTAGALAVASGDPGSLDTLVEESDRHASGVCQSLREGVLSASRDVLQALVVRNPRRGSTAGGRQIEIHESFEQALTIVYRLLFLLFAEARALVPLWHPVYRESYSIESLRDAAERSTRSRGLWDALRAIARLAHSGCRAGDLRVTPFNGRLFAPARTPLAERRGLDDEAARRAVMAVSTRRAPDGAGRERIAYRDLGVEQLGAVYETLLDYEPRVERRLVTLEPGSGVRKSTGTFYTPQPIADYLVRRTLAPLVRDAPPDQILALRIVDPAMGSGAFLVAACRYLALAYEAAVARCEGARASDIDDAERASIRRTIAERCLYGVDLNPMAVQLARLSLWLATLAADRPLSFLDHRLMTGDSLLGAWLANLRRPPAPRRRHGGDDPPLFAGDEVHDALRAALPVRFSLESTSNDTLAQVRAKERALASITAPSAALSRWKRVANLWCAAWFAGRDAAGPSAFGALSDAILTGRGALAPAIAARYLTAADDVGASRRLFHWELEFPEVFFDARGSRLPAAGFDAVLGNPPWDMIRADTGTQDARSRTRVDAASVLRFTRDAGVYSAQSDGHANRYQLFVERAMALTKSGGRLGLVLPSGLVTDRGSAPLRRMLLSRCDVDAIVGFDNHRGVFPIHRSMRFVLVTASQGAPTRRIACRLGLDDPAELESIGEEPAESSPWFPIHLTPAVLARLSGDDLAIPHVRTPLDLRIVDRAVALFPLLGSAAGWSAEFGRELNASDDRDAFRPSGRGLPIVEGKHLEPFRVALDATRHAIGAADARRLLRSDRHEHARLAYRDVASATNRVTLIAAVLPPRCASTHTVFCLRTAMPLPAQYVLCGLFNSLVVNYLVRLRVTTHVTTGIVEGLPMPTLETAPATMREIGAFSRLLARRFDSNVFAELNARVAALYQLTREEFVCVLGTFPLVPEIDRHRALTCFDERTQR